MSVPESICPSVHPHVSICIWSWTGQLVNLLIRPSIRFWSIHFFKSPSNMIRSRIIKLKDVWILLNNRINQPAKHPINGRRCIWKIYLYVNSYYIEQVTGSATVHLIGPESHVPNGIIKGCVRVRISFRVDFRVRVGFRVGFSFRVNFKVMVWPYSD